MTTKNFKVKNGIDVGVVENAFHVQNGLLRTKGGNIQIGITGANEIDTSTGNLTIDSAGGTVTVDDNFQIGSGSTVSTILDEDNMATDSDTALATQQSIKAYVDAEDANIASDTLTFTNKTFDANGTGNSISNIDFADFASGVVADEDNMASDSATKLATQQSIKAYVDGEIGNLSSTTIQEGNSTLIVSDSGSNGALTFTADGNTEMVINDTSATFSGNVIVSGNFTVNGTTTTVATSNTVVSDSLMELANGTTGTPSNDAGLVIERGDSNNAFIGFDESEDKFKMGTGTFTGASTGNLTITTGTLVANIEGNVTGAVTGNASTATALATGRTIGLSGDVTATGVSFDGTGNITLSTTIAANSVALGTDTTGNYVAAGATSGNGISGSVSSEGGTFTVTSNATNANTGSTIVFRDASGNFSAGTITANLTGTATAAQYSDLAERFAADTVYEPGTVVALGGAEEITATQEERSESVFGVVSGEHQAAFKMNGAAGTNETHPYIAMAGRVQVKVLGAISKGDRLVTSIVPGVARRAERDECTAFNVIGRALENKHTDGLGEVMCFVTAKS